MRLADLTRIAEGREAEVYAWEDGRVLRLMRSADAQQAIEWQAHALEAARAAGVSVPAAHGTTTLDGRPGLIMDRVEGPDMLTLLGRRPWWILHAGRVSGELHASLHDVVAPPDLRDLRPTMRAAIERSELLPAHLARSALEALEELPDGDRLCHGDFHPGNIIHTDGEPVVIDWSNVTRGDPTADLVRTDLLVRLGDPPPGTPLLIRVLAHFARGVLRTLYRRAYTRRRAIDDALAVRWEVAVAAHRLTEGIPEEREALLALLEARARE